MARMVRILVGTRKGLILLDGDPARGAWTLRGPLCEAWPINHAIADAATGTIHAGGGNEWFGPAVWRSSDGGTSWTHSSAGLSYGEGQEPVKTVWCLAAAHGRLYAGVEPAGLFRSDDDGLSWQHVAGLQRHPSRPHWQPGGGGLALHAILPHPADDKRLWVAISAGGVFSTADGGETWEARNQGTRNDYLPEDQRYPEYGQCVHALAMAAVRPERLYQQNHCGMYRSDDGGRRWRSIESGLPSSYGFPAVVHPQDPDTLYLFPLNGDTAGRFAPAGQAAVWRSTDGGTSWTALRTGLPQDNAFLTVLRRAMATDAADPLGIYFGTTSGELYASADAGECWRCIARHLPAITSVDTVMMDG